MLSWVAIPLRLSSNPDNQFEPYMNPSFYPEDLQNPAQDEDQDNQVTITRVTIIPPPVHLYEVLSEASTVCQAARVYSPHCHNLAYRCQP